MISIALATEDQLSEAIGERLIREANPSPLVGMKLRRGGSGYLRSRMKSWCELAQHQPLVLLTDLDRIGCAPALVQTWLGSRRAPRNLVMRVAVREIEAWLLADHDGLRRLFGNVRMPPNPDALPDAKRYLLELARKAKGTIERDLVASAGAFASQGIAYNARLTEFVSATWSPSRAAARSASLLRARKRIQELVHRVSQV